LKRPKTYWINDRAQVEAVTHPTRHEIVDRLCALGPMSVREIAHTLRRKLTSVYHHIKLLEKVGLIEVVRSSSAERGRPFIVYRAIAPRVRLARAQGEPKLRAPMTKWAKMATAQAASEYAKALSNPNARIEGGKRNLWLFRVVSTPSPKRLERMNKLLDELAELAWTPDPKPGPQLSIGWFVMPLDRDAQKPVKTRRAQKPAKGTRTQKGRKTSSRG